MTPEQAINWVDGRLLEIVCELEITTSESGKNRLGKEYEALTRLRICAEKQVMQKVKQTAKGFQVYHCLACGEQIVHKEKKVRFCSECGQRIDWK